MIIGPTVLPTPEGPIIEAASALKHLTLLLELSPQFAKPYQLLRGQYPTHCQLVCKPYFRDLGLCRLNLEDPRLHIRIVYNVSIDRHIERPISKSKPCLGSLHQRLSLHIDLSDLPHLLS